MKLLCSGWPTSHLTDDIGPLFVAQSRKIPSCHKLSCELIPIIDGFPALPYVVHVRRIPEGIIQNIRNKLYSYSLYKAEVETFMFPSKSLAPK
jgi:hypothetical protein